MPTLIDASEDAIRVSASFLDEKSLCAFSLAASRFHDATGENRKYKAQQKVLQAVVYGEEAEVKRQLDINPSCLVSNFESISITDYSGKTINESLPFKVAVCTGDIEVLEMMQPYFEQALGRKEAQVEIKKQFDKVFPNGLGEHLKKQQQNAFNFEMILQALIDAPAADLQFALGYPGQNNGSVLCQALNQFREDFAKTSQQDTVFNPEHALKVLQTYSDFYDALARNDKDSYRRDLFWRQVIGLTQRFFPACYAQAVTQGIYRIVEKNEPLKRSFNFRYSRDESFFPLVPNSGVGFSCAWWAVGGRPADGLRRASIFQKLCQTKTSGLQQFTVGAKHGPRFMCNHVK